MSNAPVHLRSFLGISKDVDVVIIPDNARAHDEIDRRSRSRSADSLPLHYLVSPEDSGAHPHPCHRSISDGALNAPLHIGLLLDGDSRWNSSPPVNQPERNQTKIDVAPILLKRTPSIRVDSPPRHSKNPISAQLKECKRLTKNKIPSKTPCPAQEHQPVEKNDQHNRPSHSLVELVKTSPPRKREPRLEAPNFLELFNNNTEEHDNFVFEDHDSNSDVLDLDSN